jgi:hypothetical protein
MEGRRPLNVLMSIQGFEACPLINLFCWKELIVFILVMQNQKDKTT